MIDLEDVEELLRHAYKEYCQYNERTENQSVLDLFRNTAYNRIETLMSGGYELEQAYQIYINEIVPDIEYAIRKIE